MQVSCEIRLLQEYRPRKGSVDDVLAVAAGDDHGDLSALQNFRHTGARPAPQIHIEDSQIGCGVCGEFLRFVEIAGRIDDLPAKLEKHFSKFEQDERLILYYKRRSLVMFCTIAVQIGLSSTPIQRRRLTGVPPEAQELKGFSGRLPLLTATAEEDKWPT